MKQNLLILITLIVYCPIGCTEHTIAVDQKKVSTEKKNKQCSPKTLFHHTINYLLKNSTIPEFKKLPSELGEKYTLFGLIQKKISLSEKVKIADAFFNHKGKRIIQEENYHRDQTVVKQTKSLSIFLHSCISGGALNAAHISLYFNADPNFCDNNKKTALHKAAGQDYPELITRLCKLGGNVDSKDEEDKIPLHYAASLPSAEVASIFLQYHSKKETVDGYGFTPYDYASMNVKAVLNKTES